MASKQKKTKILFRTTIDFDGDGDISKEEFVQNATQSKFIADLLTKTQYNDQRETEQRQTTDGDQRPEFQYKVTSNSINLL